ncbi:PH domain-containing protein [Rhodanobacter sp. 115]|uniref:PH domain-containing protein n=1 Tax=Rhodanobacter sp. FW021-MT20 TaxID=1162282 RepID=UPI0034E4BB7E
MGQYIESSLRPGERIIREACITPLALTPYVVLGLFTLPVYGFGLLLILFAAASWRATEFAITNQRLIAKYGIFARQATEIALASIETVQVRQSVIAHLFRFGNVIVAGGGAPQVVLTGIANPPGIPKRPARRMRPPSRYDAVDDPAVTEACMTTLPVEARHRAVREHARHPDRPGDLPACHPVVGEP